MDPKLALSPALSRKAGEGAGPAFLRPFGAVCAAVLALALCACGPGSGSIGAILAKQKTDGRVVVRSVPSDMESAKAGLEAGDEILSIDGRDARTMSAQEIHEALVGPVGSTVDLTVARKGTVERVKVKRGQLK